MTSSTLPRPVTPTAPRIGRWSLGPLLARGSISDVFPATHDNGSEVALKVLRRELADDEKLVRRFHRSAELVNRVQHAGVVKAIDDGVTPWGAPFLVLERVRGESAQDRADRLGGTLSDAETVEIATRLLAVLDAVHRAGVVHRNVKPTNVWIEPDGHVRLLGFGTAFAPDGELWSDLTMPGMVVGTVGFMAPEQARGRRDEVNHTADLWGVGATMTTLLTGRLVHPRSSTYEQLRAASAQPAMPLARSAPHIPAALAEVIDTALGFSSSWRWDAAEDMRRALLDAGVRGPTSEPYAKDDEEEPPQTVRRPMALEPSPPRATGWLPIIVAAGTRHGS
ncbi:MAG: serine/threonine-protein kinase [Planctomycetota bacterium]